MRAFGPDDGYRYAALAGRAHGVPGAAFTVRRGTVPHRDQEVDVTEHGVAGGGVCVPAGGVVGHYQHVCGLPEEVLELLAISWFDLALWVVGRREHDGEASAIALLRGVTDLVPDRPVGVGRQTLETRASGRARISPGATAQTTWRTCNLGIIAGQWSRSGVAVGKRTKCCCSTGEVVTDLDQLAPPCTGPV